MAFLMASSIDLARDFHAQFHVNSKTLSSQFKISRAEAREIVKACKTCAPLLPQVSVGVSPRELHPLHLWQVDVIHFLEFGKLKYMHHAIDKYSGFQLTTA